MAARKNLWYIGYATSDGRVGIYDHQTRRLRQMDLATYCLSRFVDGTELTHAAALEFSPNGEFLYAAINKHIVVLAVKNLEPMEWEYTTTEAISHMLVIVEHQSLYTCDPLSVRIWRIKPDGQLQPSEVLGSSASYGRTCITYDSHSGMIVTGQYQTGGTSYLEVWQPLYLDDPIISGMSTYEDPIEVVAAGKKMICSVLTSGKMLVQLYDIDRRLIIPERIFNIEGHSLLGCIFPIYRRSSNNRSCPIILVHKDVVVLYELAEPESELRFCKVRDNHHVTSYVHDRFGHLYLGTDHGRLLICFYGEDYFHWHCSEDVTSSEICCMACLFRKT